MLTVLSRLPFKRLPAGVEIILLLSPMERIHSTYIYYGNYSSATPTLVAPAKGIKADRWLIPMDNCYRSSGVTYTFQLAQDPAFMVQ